MTLHSESDHVHLVTDPTVVVAGPDGRPQGILPYRLGMPPVMIRRDAQGVIRHYQPGINGVMQPILPPPMHPMLAMQNITPAAMQHQIKKMQPPTTAPQMRISSNGGMRPPSVPVSTLQQQPALQPPQSLTSHSNGPTSAPHHSPPHPVPVPVPQHSSINGVNGMSRAAISMPHVDVQTSESLMTPAISNGSLNGISSPIPQPEPNAEATLNGPPARPRSQNITPQQHLGLGVPTNGYHLTPMTNMTAAALQVAYQNGQHGGGLSLQQMQNLKSAFANLPAPDMANLNGGRSLSGSYAMPNGNMQLPAGTNINLKLPATRQMQWANMNGQIQRPGSAVNVETQLNGAMGNRMVGSPNLSNSVPVRTPSANGLRPGMRNGVSVNGQHSMSPNHQHSPTPVPNILQAQSPPRLPMMPNMALASSPPLQQQQPVGNQNGY